MVSTQFKINFQKLPPRTISYRVFTNFIKSDSESDLFLALLSNPFVSHNYGQFVSTFKKILDKHDPIKRRKIRGNQKPFMNKPLHDDRRSCEDQNYSILSRKQSYPQIGRNTVSKGITVLNYAIKPEGHTLPTCSLVI